MSEMIHYLFGKEINVIVAERRSPNTGFQTQDLFANSAFAKELCEPKDTQACGSRGCLTCGVMNVGEAVTVNGIDVKLDYSLNCASNCVLYLYLC